MATFKVCFDGKWQGDFDDHQEALAWGREVGETGRLVQVAQVRRLDLELIAVFPEDRAEEGRWNWDIRNGVSLGEPPYRRLDFASPRDSSGVEDRYARHVTELGPPVYAVKNAAKRWPPTVNYDLLIYQDKGWSSREESHGARSRTT